MAVQQKAQSFVVGAAGAAAGLRWNLLTCRTAMNTTNATIRKLITVFRNWPYASTGPTPPWPPPGSHKTGRQADEQVFEIHMT